MTKKKQSYNDWLMKRAGLLIVYAWVMLAVGFFVLTAYDPTYLNSSEDYVSILAYLLGMFYNLFLPGGIGGDAYKWYVIKKTFQTPTKKIFGALLVDRLSGLLLLCVFSAFIAAIGIHELLSPFRYLFLLAVPLGVLVYYIGLKKIYPYTLAVFWKTFVYSAGVQLSQLITALCILWALDQTQDIGLYFLVFLISSIVAIIPLTIGGIGSRELTFLYGAQWLALDYKTAIAMSLLFFFITASVSLTGMVYHFRSLPEPGKNTK